MYYSTEGQIITTEIQLPHAGITGLGSWLFTWKDSPQFSVLTMPTLNIVYDSTMCVKRYYGS